MKNLRFALPTMALAAAILTGYGGKLAPAESGAGAVVTVSVNGTGSVSFACLAQNPVRQANPSTASKSMQATTSRTCPEGYVGSPYGSSYTGFRITDSSNHVDQAIDSMTSTS